MLAIFVPNGESLLEDAAKAGKLCELAKKNSVKRKFFRSKGANLDFFIFFSFFNTDFRVAFNRHRDIRIDN